MNKNHNKRLSYLHVLPCCCWIPSTILWTQLVLLNSAVDSESTHISKSKVAVLLDCLLLDYPLGYRLLPCFLRCSAASLLQLDFVRSTLCQDASLRLSFVFWTLVALLQIWFTKSAAQLPSGVAKMWMLKIH
jgi:hypothetical protein